MFCAMKSKEVWWVINFIKSPEAFVLEILINFEMDPHPSICPMNNRSAVPIGAVQKHSVISERPFKDLHKVSWILLQEEFCER